MGRSLLGFLLMAYCQLCLAFAPLFAINSSSHPFSSQEIQELERDFLAQINASSMVIRQPLANQYLTHLGKRLSRPIDKEQYPLHFFLVNSDEINAFAGPGGYIGINSGLILNADNQDELAGVLAHEIAHVTQEHLLRGINHDKALKMPVLAAALASIALGVLNPALGGSALFASLGLYQQEGFRFSRQHEREADRIGIKLLKKAGYSPYGIVAFFKKLQSHGRYTYTGDMPAILRTHPLDDERIADAQNRIATGVSKKLTPNVDFLLFKENIRVIVSNDKHQLLNYYRLLRDKSPGDIVPNYGYALALNNSLMYAKAKTILSKLIALDPDKIAYQLAMTSSEEGLREDSSALKRLKSLHDNYPDNKAINMAYIKLLTDNKKYRSAGKLIEKLYRREHSDVSLCFLLARNRSQLHLKADAYFQRARCLLQLDNKAQAFDDLNRAKHLAKSRPLLKAQIEAILAAM